MPDPHGFEYDVRGSQVVVTHHGRHATTLRGATAARFLREVESGDPQQLMARLTGNFKRGNERRGGRGRDR
jgi:hypothetical protein